ncbi:LytR/AlgR family response regulator transcription factor [Spirosoma endophyticum]|uniref:Two component transcriptional regulator, LytTR family n=1 Tax=Spirosoma endophyticum TaxID=662367 RepID=A0A1I1SVQ0_9BACT|nr:LytTR family DNA-binding domain-containing protein [Spirosoma endophyticum]SFD47973.1 two component transcriptional regulator, LytTR family [Spirosoma endophyticum]
MNVVIIEDEDRTARQLERLLKKYDPSIHVLTQLPSVKDAVAWFSEHTQPDLAFMDIHLEDGLAFRIFEQLSLTVPVIFTTAYDEYVLKAFKVNSVDYLLKPVDYEELVAAMEKFKTIRGQPVLPDLNALLQLIQKPQTSSFKERFMVTIGTKIHSIEVADIAYCYSEEKATFLVTKAGQLLPLEYSLDQLSGLVNPGHFFRVNRQFLVARTAIQAVHAYSAGKLKLDLLPVSRHEVFVSMSRLSEFKDWLGR